MRIQSLQVFGQPTISDYYRSAKEQFEERLKDYPTDKLLGSDFEELVGYFFQEASLSPIVIDNSRQTEVEKVTKKQVYKGVLGTVTKDVIYAKLIFPLEPGFDLQESFKYHTRTHVQKEYIFDFDPANFTVAVEVNLEGLEPATTEFQNLFNQRTAEINSENEELKKFIRFKVESRKQALEANNAEFEAQVQKVSIPLKIRSKFPDHQIPLNIRAQLVKLSEPSAAFKKELDLTQEQLETILKVIDIDGKNFENAPLTFSKLEEPDLRNIILSHLNHYFPDDATGETFVNEGKADIRLKVVEGQILIAECKYWHGTEELAKAIDQLFLYLTWRHNYGILVIFSKNKDFSEVLDRIKEGLQSHESFKSSLVEIASSHFKTIHIFPGDSKKQVEIHTLIYNLGQK